jgi:hypothetical protein
MSHATTELATERPAQINTTIRNPNTNASPINSVVAAVVARLISAGIAKAASLTGIFQQRV